jgi:hypothetical protein
MFMSACGHELMGGRAIDHAGKLFHHLFDARQECGRSLKAKRFARFQIDRQRDFC